MRTEKIVLIDPSSLVIDTDLGGTVRPFELSRKPRFRRVARVTDDGGTSVKVEQLYSSESLCEVTYDYGARARYDLTGNLQLLTLPIGGYFDNLDDETLAVFDQQFLEAMASVISTGTEIVLEIDLRDGLAENDGLGWVQLICEGEGLERINSGIGGFEIGPRLTREEPYQVLLKDEDEVEMGRLFLRVEVRGCELYFSLGDGAAMIAERFYLRMNPDGVELVDTPRGALRFLSSLRPEAKRG